MNYLLKLPLICFTLGSSVAGALDHEQILAARKIYDETFKKGAAYQHVRALSQTQRELLLEFRFHAIEDKRSRGESDLQIANSGAALDLALLGDDWAREQVVKAFWYEPGAKANGLLALKDPKVIAMLGEGLFMEEEQYWIGDVGFIPAQVNLAEVTIDTLGNSPEFNADVINWARRVERRYTMKMIRDWYRANEAKLKAGDFKAVQPGAEPPDSKASAPAGGAPPSLPADAKPAPAPVSFPGSVQPPASSGNASAWIAALLLAVCGGLVWLLKRKRI